MIEIYCRDHCEVASHPCKNCKELIEYTDIKLSRCSFKNNKPSCVKCPVHCYTKVNKEKIRIVMRYSGPRMIYKHPILAIIHLLNNKSKKYGKQ